LALGLWPLATAARRISGQKSERASERDDVRALPNSDLFRSNADQHSNAHHRKDVSVCVRCLLTLIRSLLHGMGRDALVLRRESVGGVVQVADPSMPIPPSLSLATDNAAPAGSLRTYTYTSAYVHVRAYTA